MGPSRRRPAVLLAFVCVLSTALIAGDASALLLYAEGRAGDLAAAERDAGPSATGPVVLPSSPIVEAGRSADVSAHVEAGVVQLHAIASASAGAQSVGNWQARVEGSWEDSMTFAADGTIPTLPGVEIVPGVSMGTATLVLTVDGTFDWFDDGSSFARADYGATLGYGILAPFAGRCCGPLWTDFRGSVNAQGETGLEFDAGLGMLVDTIVGDVPPAELRLDVSFVFGEAFDVLFELRVATELGWEGLAASAIGAEADFGHTALWGGVEDVSVIVDVGGVPTPMALPDGAWSATSSTVDYTAPFAAPVPEPTVPTLAALALLALAHRRAPRATQDHRRPS